MSKCPYSIEHSSERGQGINKNAHTASPLKNTKLCQADLYEWLPVANQYLTSKKCLVDDSYSTASQQLLVNTRLMESDYF